MNSIFVKSLTSFFSPKILFITLLPFIISTALCVAILSLIWSEWVVYIVDINFFSWMAEKFGENFFLQSLQVLAITLATLLVFAPIWYLLYMVILSVFLFPILLPVVQKKYYPTLSKQHGGNLIGSIKNAVMTSVIYLLGFLFTLPLWLFTPLAPALSILLAAYANKRIFTYDVLQDYASPSELKDFHQNNNKDLWVLSLLTAGLLWIPIINIFAPAITSLMFIHYCLDRLHACRNPGG